MGEVARAQAPAHGRTDDGARELGFDAPVRSVFERGDGAYVGRGADQDEVNEIAFDGVEPAVGDAGRLTRQRRKSAGLGEKRREPIEPQQNPALIALEA